MRALLLALCTLLPMVAPLAAAQDAEAPASGRVEIWDTPRVMDKVVVVENGTTLIIRGVTITMHAGLVVGPTGKLVLESLPGSPVVLQAGLAEGWIGVLGGETTIRGAPDAPVVIDGLTGEGLASGDTVLIRGALKLVGTMDADGVVFRNYTSGFALQPDSHLALRNATFESRRGMGLVVAYGEADVSDATFRGPGAGAWTVASGTLRMARATFQDNPLPMGVHGELLTLEDVSVTNATSSCLRATRGEVVIRGFRCSEFSGVGLDLSRPTSGFGRVHADLSGLNVSSERENKAGLLINGPDNVTIRDSVFGPLHKDGFNLYGEPPTVSNITFRGVENYNVAFINARGDVDEATWSQTQGESGAAGRLIVAASFSVRASYPDGKPAIGSIVEVRHESDDRLILRRVIGESGASEPATLEVLSIGADGQRRNHTYHVVAANVTQGLRWERESYVPDGAGLAFQFAPGSGPVVSPVPTETSPVPMPALPMLALLVGLAAVALRRRVR